MLNCQESPNTDVNHDTCIFLIYQVNMTETQLIDKVKKLKYTTFKNTQT